MKYEKMENEVITQFTKPAAEGACAMGLFEMGPEPNKEWGKNL